MERAAELFRALGEVNRLRILNILAGRGKCCVCNLQAVLDVPQTRVSKHLAVLKSAGLIQSSRLGQWTVYSLTEPPNPLYAAQLEVVMNHLPEMEGFSKDLERFDRLARRGQLVEFPKDEK